MRKSKSETLSLPRLILLLLIILFFRKSLIQRPLANMLVAELVDEMVDDKEEEEKDVPEPVA